MSDSSSRSSGRKTSRRKSNLVTIVGVVSTTELGAGEQVEVERTESVERLLSQGFVREVTD